MEHPVQTMSGAEAELCEHLRAIPARTWTRRKTCFCSPWPGRRPASYRQFGGKKRLWTARLRPKVRTGGGSRKQPGQCRETLVHELQNSACRPPTSFADSSSSTVRRSAPAATSSRSSSRLSSRLARSLRHPSKTLFYLSSSA